MTLAESGPNWSFTAKTSGNTYVGVVDDPDPDPVSSRPEAHAPVPPLTPLKQIGFYGVKFLSEAMPHLILNLAKGKQVD
ncbi:hypothetical protein RQP46_000100 [Phenoliferia psychrophenolica]